MCILALALNCSATIPFLVISNRDEMEARAAGPLQLSDNGVLSSRDTLGGGTWMGVNLRLKLFAVLTNSRWRRDTLGGSHNETKQRSRGLIVNDFLSGGSIPTSSEASLLYKGFNLISGSLADLMLNYTTNRHRHEPCEYTTPISNGFHALCNSTLDDTSWGKTQFLRDALEQEMALVASSSDETEPLALATRMGRLLCATPEFTGVLQEWLQPENNEHWEYEPCFQRNIWTLPFSLPQGVFRTKAQTVAFILAPRQGGPSTFHYFFRETIEPTIHKDWVHHQVDDF